MSASPLESDKPEILEDNASDASVVVCLWSVSLDSSAGRTNDQIVQLYQGGYVDEARESRDISEYAYRKGAASLLDYLDAERTYRVNQLAYRQALANYMLALEQVRQAVGTRNLP